jgi:hypothetical protein
MESRVLELLLAKMETMQEDIKTNQMKAEDRHKVAGQIGG